MTSPRFPDPADLDADPLLVGSMSDQGQREQGRARTRSLPAALPATAGPPRPPLGGGVTYASSPAVRNFGRRQAWHPPGEGAAGAPLSIAMLAPPWICVPPPGYGGVEEVVSVLTEALVRGGHLVTLFCAPGSTSSATVVTLLPAAHPD